jgi:hypothetical protein
MTFANYLYSESMSRSFILVEESKTIVKPYHQTRAFIVVPSFKPSFDF